MLSDLAFGVRELARLARGHHGVEFWCGARSASDQPALIRLHSAAICSGVGSTIGSVFHRVIEACRRRRGPSPR